MNKSESIKEIAAALAEFQSKVKPVIKDGTNPYFKSKYSTLENTIETIRKDLHSVGLSFSQFPVGKDSLVTILMHKTGEFIMATAEMSPKDATPQGQGSAITYMRRYALSAVLGLATEEDDDGNEATKPTIKAKPKPAAMVNKPKGVQDMVEPPFENSPTVQLGEPIAYPKAKDSENKPAKPKISDESKIAHLLKILEVAKGNAPQEVLTLTGLSLTSENFSEIVSRLEILVKERKEAKK